MIKKTVVFIAIVNMFIQDALCLHTTADFNQRSLVLVTAN